MDNTLKLILLHHRQGAKYEDTKQALLDLFGVSGSSLDREEILKIATGLTDRVPDKIHRSDMNDMEHIKANLKAAIILQLRKMNYR